RAARDFADRPGLVWRPEASPSLDRTVPAREIRQFILIVGQADAGQRAGAEELLPLFVARLGDLAVAIGAKDRCEPDVIVRGKQALGRSEVAGQERIPGGGVDAGIDSEALEPDASRRSGTPGD